MTASDFFLLSSVFKDFSEDSFDKYKFILTEFNEDPLFLLHGKKFLKNRCFMKIFGKSGSFCSFKLFFQKLPHKSLTIVFREPYTN